MQKLHQRECRRIFFEISQVASFAPISGEMLIDATFNSITSEILASAIEVHKTLAPGLLESIYQQCLEIELRARNLRYVTQRTIPILYKGIALDTSYRVDLIVEESVVVEVKALSALLAVHQAQVLTYLMVTNCPVGLLINFNEAKVMNGVKRLLRPRGTGDRGENGQHKSRRS